MKSLKNTTLLLLSILFVTVACSEKAVNVNKTTDIQIGDIQIENLSNLFDTESKYWNMEEIGDMKFYRMKEGVSETFYSSNEMVNSSLILEGGQVPEDVVALSVSKKFDLDEVLNKIKTQLTNQFGNPSKLDDMGGLKKVALKWETGEYNIELIKSTMLGESVNINITKDSKVNF